MTGTTPFLYDHAAAFSRDVCCGDGSVKSLTWAIIAILVVVLAGVAGSAAAHEIQHAAFHTPGMHSTGICAWMCTAGGAAVSSIDGPLVFLLVQEDAAPSVPLFQSLPSPRLLSARAPPSI